jgi:hypothetical protein
MVLKDDLLLDPDPNCLSYIVLQLSGKGPALGSRQEGRRVADGFGPLPVKPD